MDAAALATTRVEPPRCSTFLVFEVPLTQNSRLPRIHIAGSVKLHRQRKILEEHRQRKAHNSQG